MTRIRVKQIGAWVAVAAVVVTTALLVVARPAQAHAIVRATRPRIDEVVARSPERVVMHFNEPVEINFGSLRVFDTAGRRVDEGEPEHLAGQPDAIQVALQPDLEMGTYTVTWRVISADGHPIAEAFVFHVKEPGENPEGIAARLLGGEQSADRLTGTLFGVSRWLTFAGLLIFCGALIFAAVSWRTAPAADAAERFAKRWSVTAVAAWVATLLATLSGLIFQGAVAGQLGLTDAASPSVIGEVVGTKFGMVAIARIVLLVLLLLVAFMGRRALSAAQNRSVGAAAAARTVPPWLAVAAAVLIVAVLATPGLGGHAGTTSPATLNIATDTLHLLGASAWFGGLVLLLTAAFPATRGLEERERVRVLAPVVSRFSDTALVAVVVIVATGVYRSWEEVEALRALTGATYGWVLLAKIAIFLPAVILGGINNRWMKPRLHRAMSNAEGESSLQALHRLIAAEVALILGVLAVTAFLVNLPPARVEAGVSGPFVQDVRLGPYSLNVVVRPNNVGENDVHLIATTREGAPVHAREMRVLFRMPEEEIGPLVGRGEELAHGHFVVRGRQLSIPGEWHLEIVARTGRFDEERATVGVPVNP